MPPPARTRFPISRATFRPSSLNCRGSSTCPMLIGALLAAPIALEIEQGTYRLAWTQSVTRSRWALVRLGAPILVGLGIGSLVAAISSWSMEPVNQVQGALRPGSFD